MDDLLKKPNLKNKITEKVLKNGILKISVEWEVEFLKILGPISFIPSTLLEIKEHFPKVYQEIYSPYEAAKDYKKIEGLSAEKNILFSIQESRNSGKVYLKIFNYEKDLSLSDIMPIFQNLGLFILNENSFYFSDHKSFLKIFTCTLPKDLSQGSFFEERASYLLCALESIFKKEIEDDALNELIILSGITPGQVNWLRAYMNYMKCTQFSASFDYIARVLKLYPHIALNLVNLFEERFNPFYKQKTNIYQQLQDDLKTITHPEHDRILKYFIACILATVRTNAFQTKNKLSSCLSFKIESKKVPNLPLPVPLYEIYVYSSFMEGIHLRMGKISRGGIRWSECLEDYRQEILNLVKTQNIKNAAIIPLGAKGGFISKQYEFLKNQNAPYDELQNEVRHCYKAYIHALLDITDNLQNGKVEHPNDTLIYDEADPYFVVAADKGTASFSDMANKIAMEEYNFWLGDAFASGGSKGYNHKALAITSRGAFISVANHFKALNHDVYQEPFTVVGVGDMSGDIFGNGMLLSKYIQLIGAFNHQYIFIDPYPDHERSYQERKRLFQLSHSNWNDYNLDFVSKGGGVFSRSSKSILLTPEIKEVFHIPSHIQEISPEELIRYLLKAPVDLIWFGGIGTYVKASYESHADAKDHGNDSIRISSSELQAKVIGEGANLAMTQKARIEFSLKGGYVNTDAIDNSGGVDCSDHEVNLKILCQDLIKKGILLEKDRFQLLQEIQSEVTELVLKTNSSHNAILTFLTQQSGADLEAYQDLIHKLEVDENICLDKKLEALPDDEEIKQRLREHQGLTRPELAVIVAYAKMSIYQRVLNLIPRDINEPLLKKYLLSYFPKTLQSRYGEFICQHFLRREILATVCVNHIINQMGPLEAYELLENGTKNIWKILKAYLHVNDMFFNSLRSLDAECKIKFIKQIVNIYLKHVSSSKMNLIEDNLNSWSPYFSINHLSVMFEFVCQEKEPSSTAIEEKAHTFETLNQIIKFDRVTALFDKIYCHAPWQRKAKSYLLESWLELQYRLVNRCFHSTKNLKHPYKHLEENKLLKEVQLFIKQAEEGMLMIDIGAMGYLMHKMQRLL